MNWKNALRPSILMMVPAAILLTGISSKAGDTTEAGARVRMTVTANVENGKRAPQIEKQDVFVQAGKNRLQVAEWTPAREEHAGLELFVLIDDASRSTLGSHLDDLRSFIQSQPATTAVGVGYARNATVEILQNLTNDHDLASKALRLPLGSAGAFGSPYLSVTDLMNRWPATENRREVILLTDGIDRAGRARNALMNPDVDAAAAVAQRTGTLVHTIYFPGVGHWHRNWWDANNGQNGIAKLAELTGGESYFLGLHDPVSIRPYLDDLKKVLDNQYLVTFFAKPAKKAGLQYLSFGTEVAGVDFNAANAVWVPASR